MRRSGINLISYLASERNVLGQLYRGRGSFPNTHQFRHTERLPWYSRRFTRPETRRMAGTLPQNSVYHRLARSPLLTLPIIELLVSRLGTLPENKHIPFLSTLRSCCLVVCGPTRSFKTSKHSRSSASFFACRWGLGSQADDSSRFGTVPPR